MRMERKVHVIMDAKGNKFKVPKITKFALERGISRSNLSGLINGHVDEYAGFTFVKTIVNPVDSKGKSINAVNVGRLTLSNEVFTFNKLLLSI